MWLLRGLILCSLSTFVLAQQCNWNGRYENNRCQCFQGFMGDDCSLDCYCERHGTCSSDGTCSCEKGWKWSASDHKCVWDCHCQDGVQCIGPGECGCQHTCTWGACRNGQCVCYEGYKGDDCSRYDPSIMQNDGVDIGINIAGVTYYSSEVKWVDVAKQSQSWITERVGRNDWDTQEQNSVQWRPDGYPARLDGDMRLVKLMLRNFGQFEEMGNYTILYDGDGTLEFSLTEEHILYDGKGRMVINFPHINDGGILLKLTSTNPSNPIRNIRVLPPGYENTYERFPFHPLFLEFIQRFSEIRFMDYLSTNGHRPEPTTWESRKPANYHTQEGQEGGAIEYLVQLSNTVGANPWVCMPHAADDNYVRQFATYMKGHLRPDLKVYVEYSNEVWNGIFRQTQYTREKGQPLFPDDPGWKAGMKYFNVRATQVAQIWNEVWGSQRNRVTNVYAWQTGFQDYYRQALADLGDRKSSFQALAITGYFDCDGAAEKHASELPGMSMQQIQQLCENEAPSTRAYFRHFMDVAEANSLKLVMYEGGPGVMENGAIVSGANVQAVTDKAIAFNRDPAIAKPVEEQLNAWFDIATYNSLNGKPGGLFNYFSSTGLPSKYGSWGMTEYTGQDLSTVPKWLAVQGFISDRYPNNTLGPKCSFVKNRESGQAFGCFPRSNGRYTCAGTADDGRTWTNLPSLNQHDRDHVTLDGLDEGKGRLYVRVTDRTAVTTYQVYDQRSTNWTKMKNFQYYTEVMSPSVTPRFPTGGSHGLLTEGNC